MQRCCARIAGLNRVACRSNSKSTSQPWTPFSTPYSVSLRRQSTKPRQQHEGYIHLTGADVDSSLAAIPRQSVIRQQQAWHKGGFGHIDDDKLPSRHEASKIESWMPIIDAALPSRLRVGAVGKDEPYSSQDITRILCIAGTRYGLDLLTHLAVDKDRWKAVVWLITQVVDHNFKADASSSRVDNVWSTHQNLGTTLADMTRRAIRLECKPASNPTGIRPPPSLDQLTDDLHPLNEPLVRLLRHDSLGQIWQSLGHMIIADAARLRDKSAGEAIRPEILEIIALLHHRGAMPSSIYSYQPAEDSLALRQPPTLQLLSHQIITSLTDAAWRAHETLVVEEAKAKGGVYNSLRHTIPGSMYKVHVAGLGHEVWLELVLWSCLHGRFFAQGAAILESVAKQKDHAAWSVLSWRELASPIIQAGQEKSINWDEVKYIFNTGLSSTDIASNHDKVKRTVSTEVVAAFVDGLVSDIRRGVGARGIAPTLVVRYLLAMKRFLERNNMSLGFTSWDAIILRIMDSEGIDVDQDPDLARRIIGLSSQFGDEISAVNAPIRNELWQPTPAYVLDGTAANLGHMHRVLRAHVRLGNLRGALHVFESLQKVTDQNKQRSIQEFFAKQRDANPTSHESTSTVDFEGRYSGIDYPSFFPSIPTTILAPFVDLVIDADALEFGSWLLHSKDVDGPIISESLYGDSIMGPALIRLAASMGDKDVLMKIFDHQRQARQGQVPQDSMTALMEYQIEAHNWRFVERALENLTDLPDYSVSMHAAAVMVRIILREATSSGNGLQNLDKTDSKVLRRMMDISAHPRYPKLHELAERVWRMLACINDEWKDYAFKAFPRLSDPYTIRLRARAFNLALRGVIDAYGSGAGKHFLAMFWFPANKNIGLRDVGEDDGGVRRMPKRRDGTRALTSPSRRSAFDTRRIVLHGPDRQRARFNVNFTPDLTSVRQILRQALLEHQEDSELIDKDINWARQIMQQLGLRERSIKAELDSVSSNETEEMKKASDVYNNVTEA